MSKLFKIAVTCPQCNGYYEDNFFRTIWGEHEVNRQMVMEDRINIATCPHCGHKFHLPLAMMYVDVVKGFAVWWEPNHDPGIDADAAGYSKILGPNSYYAQAPRIADWEEFKCVINEYYDGKRECHPIDPSQFKSISSLGKPKKSGCAGMIAIAIVIAGGVFMLL